METEKIILPCDCQCCMLVIDKYFLDEKYDYNISVQSSYYQNPSSFISRIKAAFKILFGKPIYYNDAYISENRMKLFYDKLTVLMEKK